MKKIYLTAFALVVFSGCASASRIVPEGPDSYMIMKQAGSGFSGTEQIKMDAIEDANAFCSKSGKQFMITRTNESGGGAFRYPNVQIGFMCLNPTDKELARPKLVPAPNSIVEVRH